jgi:hypothetical protein
VWEYIMSETRSTLQEATAISSPATSTYWKYRRQEAENGRRIAAQREARLSRQSCGLPPVSGVFRNRRMVEKWTEQLPTLTPTSGAA